MGAGFSGLFSGLFKKKAKKSTKVAPSASSAKKKDAAAKLAAKTAADSAAAAAAATAAAEEAAERSTKKQKKNPPVNVEDLRSILALYDSTDGGHWEKRGGWRTPLPVPQWFGLQVNASRIVELALGNNSLKGLLPAAIGSLPGLVKLGLNENAIRGKLPDTLLQLKVSR